MSIPTWFEYNRKLPYISLGKRDVLNYPDDAYVAFPLEEPCFDDHVLLPPYKRRRDLIARNAGTDGVRWRQGDEIVRYDKQRFDTKGYLPYEKETPAEKATETKDSRYLKQLYDVMRRDLLDDVQKKASSPTDEKRQEGASPPSFHFPSIQIPDEELGKLQSVVRAFQNSTVVKDLDAMRKEEDYTVHHRDTESYRIPFAIWYPLRFCKDYRNFGKSYSSL